MSTVLVTGGSGFIARYCILDLLAQRHTVRTSVGPLAREASVRDMLEQGGAILGSRLTFVVADPMDDAGWQQAVAGCDYVLHVGSPFPSGIPKHEDDIIRPACEGTLRVLRASRNAGVKRVVLTSSFAAIGYGHKQQSTPLDKSYWTNLDAPVSADTKSKTLAERAAWDFMKREGGALEPTVVNPVGVFGPVLGADYSSSIATVESLVRFGLLKHL